jgi:hypothetical protein
MQEILPSDTPNNISPDPNRALYSIWKNLGWIPQSKPLDRQIGLILESEGKSIIKACYQRDADTNFLEYGVRNTNAFKK